MSEQEIDYLKHNIIDLVTRCNNYKVIHYLDILTRTLITPDKRRKRTVDEIQQECIICGIDKQYISEL